MASPIGTGGGFWPAAAEGKASPNGVSGASFSDGMSTPTGLGMSTPTGLGMSTPTGLGGSRVSLRSTRGVSADGGAAWMGTPSLLPAAATTESTDALGGHGSALPARGAASVVGSSSPTGSAARQEALLQQPPPPPQQQSVDSSPDGGDGPLMGEWRENPARRLSVSMGVTRGRSRRQVNGTPSPRLTSAEAASLTEGGYGAAAAAISLSVRSRVASFETGAAHSRAK